MNDPRPSALNEPDDIRDARLSELYRATRDTEPPAWLDQRILTAARTAVKSHPTPIISRSRLRNSRFWATPVALAATVVLVVGVWRLSPLVGGLDKTPAVLEEQASRAQAQPAAKPDATRTESVQPTRSVPAAPPASMQAVPAPSAVSQPFTPASRSVESPRQSEGKANLHDLAIRRSLAAWRAEIAELRRQGRQAEAEARLAEFRRQYPHEALDEAEPPQ